MKPQLTKEAFAAWCEKQPKNKRYNLFDRKNCALGQFAQSLGYFGSTGDFSIEVTEGYSRPLTGLCSWEANDALADRPRTFGKLAQRLRA